MMKKVTGLKLISGWQKHLSHAWSPRYYMFVHLSDPSPILHCWLLAWLHPLSRYISNSTQLHCCLALKYSFDQFVHWLPIIQPQERGPCTFNFSAELSWIGLWTTWRTGPVSLSNRESDSGCLNWGRELLAKKLGYVSEDAAACRSWGASW